MVGFKNDSSRLKSEYNALQEKNMPLFDAINDLDAWISTTLNKPLILTMIYRTPEEQDELYKDDPKYQTKPFKSPHQFNQAADVHSLDFSQDEIDQIVNYLNDKYNATNYYSFSALFHQIDNNGLHLHFQYYKVR